MDLPTLPVVKSKRSLSDKDYESMLQPTPPTERHVTPYVDGFFSSQSVWASITVAKGHKPSLSIFSFPVEIVVKLDILRQVNEDV